MVKAYHDVIVNGISTDLLGPNLGPRFGDGGKPELKNSGIIGVSANWSQGNNM